MSSGTDDGDDSEGFGNIETDDEEEDAGQQWRQNTREIVPDVPLLSQDNLLKHAVPSAASSRTTFKYELWDMNVEVKHLQSNLSLQGWQRAGHHPHFCSLYFTVNVGVETFAICSSIGAEAEPLLDIVPSLSEEGRWDCVMQLAAGLAMLHHRGVRHGRVSAHFAVGRPLGGDQWEYRWNGMEHTTLLKDSPLDMVGAFDVRAFGELALEEILEVYINSEEPVYEKLVEKLRICLRYKTDDDSAFHLTPPLQALVDTFSETPGFWDVSLQHYEASSAYLSAIANIASGQNAKAAKSLQTALQINPFLAPARHELLVLEGQETWNSDQTALLLAPETRVKLSLSRHAGRGPVQDAGIATQFLEVGWVAEAWWQAVQSLQSMQAMDDEWSCISESLQSLANDQGCSEEDCDLGTICDTSSTWHEAGNQRAQKTLQLVRKKASLWLKKMAVCPLLLLPGVPAAASTTSSASDGDGNCTTELFQNPPGARHALLWHLSCSTTSEAAAADPVAQVLSGRSEDLEPLCIHVVHPNGILVWCTGATLPNSGPWEVLCGKEGISQFCKQRMSLFFEYRDNTWDNHALLTRSMKGGILHSLLLPGSVSPQRTLLLVHPDNLLEVFALPHKESQRKSNTIAPVLPSTTTPENLLAQVSNLNVQGRSKDDNTVNAPNPDGPAKLAKSGTVYISAGARAAANLKTTALTDVLVMGLVALPKVPNNFFIFLCLNGNQIKLLTVSLDKMDGHNQALTVVQAYSLEVSNFPVRPAPSLETAGDAGIPLTQSSGRKTLRKLFKSKVLTRAFTDKIDGMESNTVHYKYVILGGGNAAGYAAREFVAQQVPKSALGIISAEDYAPYERPALSKGVLLGKAKLPHFHTCAAEEKAHAQSWYDEHGITLHLGSPVVEAKLSQNRLVTENGMTVTFDYCMLCTGASPLQLTIPGATSDVVHYLRTLADAERILESCERSPNCRVAILGGGYLAMEISAALTKRNHKVTMAFPGQHVMSRLFTLEIAKFYEEFYEQKGVQILRQHSAERIETNDKDSHKLYFANGTTLEASVVIACVGATVIRDLYQGELIFQGRGVKVNGHMQTSLDNVYAVGDLCSFSVKRLGRAEVMEHVKHARESAKHAVRHMIGTASLKEYDYMPFFYSRVFDLSWELHGDPQGMVYVGSGEEDRGDGKLKICAVWVSSSGRVNGVLLESASQEELLLAKTTAQERKSVSMEMLKQAKTCGKMIDVLKTASQVACNKEDKEIPCALSKAEVARMLQKLPQTQYTHLCSKIFSHTCNTAFWSATEGEGEFGTLNGEALRQAVLKILEPYYGNIVSSALTGHEQLSRFLSHYGGTIGQEHRVQQNDFTSFVRFCLAWCIWCKHETTHKKQKALGDKQITTAAMEAAAAEEEHNERMQTHTSDSDRRTSLSPTKSKTQSWGLDTVPDSAVPFFLPNVWEAVLCLEQRLVYWKLPFDSGDVVGKGEEVIQIHYGCSLPYALSDWNLCRSSHLVALAKKPFRLVVLHSAYGSLRHVIALGSLGRTVSVFEDCSLSVSNGLVAVSLAGTLKLWTMDIKGFEDFEPADVMQEALQIAATPVVLDTQLASSELRQGWRRVGHLKDEDDLFPPFASFDTPCWKSHECLILQDAVLCSTRHSLHAWVSQQALEKVEKSETSKSDESGAEAGPMKCASQSKLKAPSQLHVSRNLSKNSHTSAGGIVPVQLQKQTRFAPFSNPTCSISHLRDVWVQVQMVVEWLRAPQKSGTSLEESRKRSKGASKEIQPGDLLKRAAALEGCFRLATPLQQSLYPKLQECRLALAEEALESKEHAKHASKGGLRNAVLTVEGRALVSIVSAAVDDTGDQMLLVLDGGDRGVIEFWCHNDEVDGGGWRIRCSSCVQLETKSRPVCAFSGNAVMAVTAATSACVWDTEDADLLMTLPWPGGSIAKGIWQSRDGQMLAVHTASEVHLWVKNKLTQTVNAAAAIGATKQCLHGHSSSRGKKDGHSQSLRHANTETWLNEATAASCHLDSTSGACSLAVVAGHRSVMVLQGAHISTDNRRLPSKASGASITSDEGNLGEEQGKKIAYVVACSESVDVLGLWLKDSKLLVLLADRLQLWTIPNISADTTSYLLPSDEMITGWAHSAGGAPHFLHALESSNNKMEVLLPMERPLRPLAFNWKSRILLGGDNKGAVFGFVVPTEKNKKSEKKKQIHPQWAATLPSEVSAAMTANGDMIILAADNWWSHWTFEADTCRLLMQDLSTCEADEGTNNARLPSNFLPTVPASERPTVDDARSSFTRTRRHSMVAGMARSSSSVSGSKSPTRPTCESPVASTRRPSLSVRPSFDDDTRGTFDSRATFDSGPAESARPTFDGRFGRSEKSFDRKESPGPPVQRTRRHSMVAGMAGSSSSVSGSTRPTFESSVSPKRSSFDLTEVGGHDLPSLGSPGSGSRSPKRKGDEDDWWLNRGGSNSPGTGCDLMGEGDAPMASNRRRNSNAMKLAKTAPNRAKTMPEPTRPDDFSPTFSSDEFSPRSSSSFHANSCADGGPPAHKPVSRSFHGRRNSEANVPAPAPSVNMMMPASAGRMLKRRCSETETTGLQPGSLETSNRPSFSSSTRQSFNRSASKPNADTARQEDEDTRLSFNSSPKAAPNKNVPFLKHAKTTPARTAPPKEQQRRLSIGGSAPANGENDAGSAPCRPSPIAVGGQQRRNSTGDTAVPLDTRPSTAAAIDLFENDSDSPKDSRKPVPSDPASPAQRRRPPQAATPRRSSRGQGQAAGVLKNMGIQTRKNSTSNAADLALSGTIFSGNRAAGA